MGKESEGGIDDNSIEGRGIVTDDAVQEGGREGRKRELGDRVEKDSVFSH